MMHLGDLCKLSLYIMKLPLRKMSAPFGKFQQCEMWDTETKTWFLKLKSNTTDTSLNTNVYVY